MNKAEEALANIRRWLCENLSDGDAGKVCDMLSVVSRYVNEREDENDKLRELLVDACGYINHPANASWTHMRRKEARDSLNGRLRELGIEAVR